MRGHLLLAAGFVLAVLSARAGPATKPATKPSKPPSYAELKAEVETLRAEVDRLQKEIAKLKPAPAARGIPHIKAVKIGMTKAELDAIGIEPDHTRTHETAAGVTETYYFGLPDLETVTLKDGIVVEIRR